MLSAVLRSPTAIQVSICIMESFVKMRRYLVSNIGLFQRLEQFEIRQKNTEKQVDKILHIIDESRNLKQEQGIFFDGQIFDAYNFASNLIKSAKKTLVLSCIAVLLCPVLGIAPLVLSIITHGLR